MKKLPNYKKKYQHYNEIFKVSLKDRTWPDQIISKAPIWCSVDLRDGNQALVNPMNISQKKEMFEMLCQIGFKEIEIGFPSAAQIEYDFARILIEEKLIPDDVFPQVLTQARPELIEKTFSALKGSKQAIVHLYNSTSELQRRVVFRKSKEEIIEIAVEGTKLVKKLADSCESDIRFEYSPESFTGTELRFAIDVCRAVIEAWQPSPDKKMIINLPATVEMITPNVFADQVEWMIRELKPWRDSLIISLHTHNDRGTGVAATELGLMAGADRVEGTLFGNGERTGNLDVITVALNMYSQGVYPNLNLNFLPKLKEVYERCTELKVPERHPYSGELVFTAFSGSHQDAIRKGKHALVDGHDVFWEVPYLPIDPEDLGREYEPIIRINSQSGKGGVAYILESNFGFMLPKAMHPDFSKVIQGLSESKGKEVQSREILQAFDREYFSIKTPYEFISIKSTSEPDEQNNQELYTVKLKLKINGNEIELEGKGNGPVDASKNALLNAGCPDFKLTHFSEHALSSGSDAEAAAYIQIEFPESASSWGVGKDPSTVRASIRALISAINRGLTK
jgi:2-isopropylmalate synthase